MPTASAIWVMVTASTMCGDHPGARTYRFRAVSRWITKRIGYADHPIWRAGRSCSQDGNLVLLAVRIPGHQGKTFAASLRDQHPVERIPVDRRKLPGGDRAGEVDRKLPESGSAMISAPAMNPGHPAGLHAERCV
jgi:hypothetical protein